MERLMKVTGEGKIRVRPDQVEIGMIASGRDSDYLKAMAALANTRYPIYEALHGCGFDTSDLKTIKYHIGEHLEYSYDSAGVRRSRIDGYEYRHEMKVVFDIDKERLTTVLAALRNSNINPEINIVYSIKDKAKAKEQLLEMTVKDSMKKAKVLANATGVQLGNIVSVDYSWGEVKAKVSYMGTNYAKNVIVDDTGYVIALEPEDIELRETVTVDWEIQ